MERPDLPFPKYLYSVAILAILCVWSKWNARLSLRHHRADIAGDVALDEPK